MRARFTILSMLIAALAGAMAYAKPERQTKPKGDPPEIVDAAAVVKDDRIILHVHKVQLVPEERQREVVKDGVKVVEKYIAFRPVVTISERPLDPQITRVTTRGGKPIELKALPKLLAKPAPVAFFTGDVDPGHLEKLAPNAIVISVPRPAPKK
jgi:hypothetical protein